MTVFMQNNYMLKEMPMTDKRILRRKESLFYLKIVDSSSGELIGRLVDITADGFKLVSRQAIELNKEFNLVLELPEPFDGDNKMTFKATSLHIKKDINPDYNDTGFQFLDLSKENLKKISLLMKKYIFEN